MENSCQDAIWCYIQVPKTKFQNKENNCQDVIWWYIQTHKTKLRDQITIKSVENHTSNVHNWSISKVLNQTEETETNETEWIRNETASYG